jgi:hypothetical protein
MVEASLTFIVTVAAALTAGGLTWFARKAQRDLNEFLTAVQHADQRSRDNAEVLDEHGFIEQSDTNHIRRETDSYQSDD